MAVELYQRLAEAKPVVNDRPLNLASEMEDLGGARWIEEAKDLVGDAPVYTLAKTKTRADLGFWLVYPKIWILVCEDAVHLAAWGGLVPPPRPYRRSLGTNDLSTVLYNDITGELLLQPAGPSDLPGLRCDPATGYHLVAHIERYLTHVR